MKNFKNSLLGAHMSISEGLDGALRRGESINCNTIQFFLSSNRQWLTKILDKEKIERYKNYKKGSSIKLVIAHAKYLINLGSPSNDIRTKSIDSLIHELINADLIDLPYLVMHPGASLGTDEATCITKIAQGIDEAFAQSKSKTILLLENTAGQASYIGYKFEQLAQIKMQSKASDQIGVCFDTCHAFAAGYTFNDQESYTALWQNFNDILGVPTLKALHLNDSKNKLGSKVDRHEDIGKGQIGLNGFSFIMNDSEFINLPKIIEMPKGDDELADDSRNLNVLRGLIRKQ